MMNRFELASELRGRFDLEELQRLEIVASPDEDMSQEQIESIWDSGDANYLILVDDDECEDVYNKLIAE